MQTSIAYKKYQERLLSIPIPGGNGCHAAHRREPGSPAVTQGWEGLKYGQNNDRGLFQGKLREHSMNISCQTSRRLATTR